MNTKPGAKDGAMNSRINPEMVMEGMIRSSNAVVVEGLLMGDIRCDQDVVVTGTGTVVGTIVSRCATIEGKVEGNMFIYERLRFQGEARMDGDIHTPKLEVTSMAAFNGKCHMSAPAEIEGIVRKMDDGGFAKPNSRTGS
jgi:cytoskeletal protein CcmA (bactofilin family)